MKQKLLDDGTLYVEVKHALQVKRVLIEDREHWGTMFYPEEPIDLVRCAECIHFTKLSDGWGRCNAHSKTAQTIDFCSWAERRASR